MTQYVLWFKNIRKESSTYAGEKGAHLGELQSARIPVPPGFVVTTEAYNQFVKKTRIDEQIKGYLDGINAEEIKQLEEKAQSIQRLVLKTQIPEEIEEAITESYELLGIDKPHADQLMDGKEEFVAVRSSPINQLNRAERAAYLNVKGTKTVLNAIRACWASLFTPRAIYNRAKNQARHSADTAVIIQRMVNAQSAGKMCTINPGTRNAEEIAIEAAQGLGEIITSGVVSPDIYIVDKKTCDVKRTDVREQKEKIVREHGKNVRKKIPRAEDRLQVLTDRQIGELARLAKKIEQHYSTPQDIEWALERDSMYIVQTHAVSMVNNEYSQEKQQEEERNDQEKNAESASVVEEPVKEKTNKSGISQMQKENQEPQAVQEKNQTEREQETKKQPPRSQPRATNVKVTLDFPNHGEKIAALTDGVGLLRIELIVAHSGIHPAQYIHEKKEAEYTALLVNEIEKVAKVFTGKPIWVRHSDLRTDEYRNLTGGNTEPEETDPILGWHGIRRLLDEPRMMKAEIMALKELHDKGYKNIGITLPFVINVEELQQAKSIMRECGLEPQRNIKIGIMIETPATCWTTEEFCKEGIDFISFGVNDLTQLTLGIDKESPKVNKQFDEMHPAVLRQMSHVITICKEYGVETNVCGSAASTPEMVAYLVKKGINNISARPDMVQKIRETVEQKRGQVSTSTPQ
jgi:pyruvate, water dikinase